MPAAWIDVHAHFLPDEYRSATEAAGHGAPDGMDALPAWSASGHLALMDRLEISTSLLSISSPGVYFGDAAAARELATVVNDEGSRCVRAQPGRFGHLASVPLPDIEGSLEEVARCCDELGSDGFALLTHVDGVYLGDPVLEPVFEELDRRCARVFIHPTSPVCWDQTSFGRPRPMLEFLFDTTRAVVNMVLNGTIARYPNIEYVIPHAGATLPMIADRVAAFSLVVRDVDPAADVMTDLARLHYDLAGFPVPRQLEAILALTTLEHLHYGSDYPFTPEFVVELAAGQLDSADVSTDSMAARLAANTVALFPSLLPAD